MSLSWSTPVSDILLNLQGFFVFSKEMVLILLQVVPIIPRVQRPFSTCGLSKEPKHRVNSDKNSFSRFLIS